MIQENISVLVTMFHMIGCDFTSFSTVFQSYQDDELIIMKGYVWYVYD